MWPKRSRSRGCGVLRQSQLELETELKLVSEEKLENASSRGSSCCGCSCHRLSALSSFWNLIKVYTSKQMTVCSRCRDICVSLSVPVCVPVCTSACMCVCVCVCMFMCAHWCVTWPQTECRRQVASQANILLKKSCGTKIVAVVVVVESCCCCWPSKVAIALQQNSLFC